ncbi:hypothetical protein Q5752_006815 [Cryptotrichosporon argae]
MAPIGGFRILFLIEGLFTFVIGIAAAIILPEDIDRCRWLKQDGKDYVHHIWAQDFAPESEELNWTHVKGTFLRGQQMNGFKGANAQIATLAPYGSAAVMVFTSSLSDRYRNRGWPTQFGWWIMIVAFGIYLGVPNTNHAARSAALILAETGHYICTPLIVTWAANNAGNESLRAVVVPFVVPCAQAVAAGSGYLFPSTDSPHSRWARPPFLLWREYRKRDRAEGKPAPDAQPDTATYADDAPGFRYLE